MKSSSWSATCIDTRSPRAYPGLSAITFGSRKVPVVGAMPLIVIQVVAHADGRVRNPDVVTHNVERVPPPRIATRVDGIQHLLEIQADLETNQALLVGRSCVRDPVSLGRVRHREQ